MECIGILFKETKMEKMLLKLKLLIRVILESMKGWL